MGKNEKIKEQIGWLKVVFGLLVATVFSLIGWMASHYHHAEPVMMISAMVVVLILVYGIVVTNLKAFQKMDELEEM